MSEKTKMLNGENTENDTVSFETALDMAGFGFYSYFMTCLTGLIVVSYSCIAFGKTIIIPASTCELETTTAENGHIAAWPLFGTILGGVVTGHLGDKYGRRRMLFFSLISAAIINGISSISVNWVMLLLLQILASFCVAGQYSLALTILSESVPMRKRNLVILLVTSLFLFSVGIMAVIAMPVIPLTFSYYLPFLNIHWNSWRAVLLIFSIPSLLSAFLLMFVMESPKYVFAQGREEEAIQIIKKIHRLNKGKSAHELKIKRLTLDAWQQNGPLSRKDQIVPLFKMPLIRYTATVTCLFVFQPFGAFSIWLPTITNQFVKTIKTGGSIHGTLCDVINNNVHVTVAQNAAPCSINRLSLVMVVMVTGVEAVSNALLSLVVNKFGRRNTTICMIVACGSSGIIANLIPYAYVSAAFFLFFQIGIVVLGLYAAIAVALFPTHLRALAVALTMAGGQMGSFISVQLLNKLLETNCKAGLYLFSTIFLCSAVLVATIPNDNNSPKLAEKQEIETAATD